VLRLPAAYRDAIVRQALDERPNECCGLIAGQGGRAMKLTPTRNEAASPYRYTIHPQDLIRAISHAVDQGWDEAPLAIYHSHTHTEAYPSSTDVAIARNPMAWKGVSYILVSLEPAARGEEPIVRSFKITDDAVIEEELLFSDEVSAAS
jgi:proteasome lid subunit RPN8/RPN11